MNIKTLTIILITLIITFVSIAGMAQERGRSIRVISPLIGVDNNTVEVHVPQPMMPPKVVEQEDTALEYGLFALYSTEHFTINNFLFMVPDINEADIWGNVFFANYYYNPSARVTPNLGFGYVYHKIEMDENEVVVKTPLPKLGLRIDAPEWNMYLNPYVCWTAEKVETTHSESTDESMLYGLTVGWRWRMMSAYAKYYYQDVLDSDKTYNVARFRYNFFLSKTFGIASRLEYMEHSTSDDISFLIGPAFTF